MQIETKSEAAATLEALVRKQLGAKAAGRTIGMDDSLVDAGLTSLDLVKLMLAVEGAFDVTIPESELTPASFRSIATMVEMLGRAGVKT